jgi:hypothetical protein
MGGSEYYIVILPLGISVNLAIIAAEKAFIK